jgi:hypothetical protein
MAGQGGGAAVGAALAIFVHVFLTCLGAGAQRATPERFSHP